MQQLLAPALYSTIFNTKNTARYLPLLPQSTHKHGPEHIIITALPTLAQVIDEILSERKR
jgi:hypothetical protein